MIASHFSNQKAGTIAFLLFLLDFHVYLSYNTNRKGVIRKRLSPNSFKQNCRLTCQGQDGFSDAYFKAIRHSMIMKITVKKSYFVMGITPLGACI